MGMTRACLVVERPARRLDGMHLPQVYEAFVASNNAQPVAKALWHGETVHVLKRLEKGVLGQVLREGKVAPSRFTHTPYTTCLCRSTSVPKAVVSPCRVRLTSAGSLRCVT